MTLTADVMGRSMLLLVKQADEAISQRDELLAVLKDLLEYAPSLTANQRKRISAAEAAIAKAEGQ